MTIPKPKNVELERELVGALALTLDKQQKHFGTQNERVFRLIYGPDYNGFLSVVLRALTVQISKMAAMLPDPDEGIDLVKKILDDYRTMEGMAKYHVDFFAAVRKKENSKPEENDDVDK